jgi:hypothetical protein
MRGCRTNAEISWQSTGVPAYLVENRSSDSKSNFDSDFDPDLLPALTHNR